MQETGTLREDIEAIARGAGEIMLAAQHERPGRAGIDENPDTVEAKEGHVNFVTKYDKAVQDYLYERLEKRLPEAHFLGEEEGQEVFLPEYAKGYTFVVDPIDGTTNFIKGFHPSVTSIGLLKDGKPYLGVVYCPEAGKMFSGQLGEGAFENGERIRSSRQTLAESLFGVGTATYYEELQQPTFDVMLHYEKRGIDLRRTGSAAYDICMVASGRTGLFVELRLGLWDYAAASVILTEAGGRITNVFGEELPFTGKSSILAVSEGVKKEDYLPKGFSREYLEGRAGKD